MLLSGETSCQTSDALLEFLVLGGVNERVDAAIGEHQYHRVHQYEHQYHGEVVEPVDKSVDAIEGQ